MGFLGSLFKAILSPLTNWIFSLLYGLLIRGPLTWLNYLDKAFQYASGAQVDKLLFNTTLVDGKPQLNFFTSDSPLKYFFMVILACVGALLAVFITFSMIHAATGKRGAVYKKVGRTFFGASMIFALPVLFLSALSIMGSLIATISGQHVAISNQNITAYRQNLPKTLKALKAMNASNFANKDKKMRGVSDDKGNLTTYSVNDIYNNLQKLDKWEITSNDPIVSLAQAGQTLFLEIQSRLLELNHTTLNKNYLRNINVIEHTLNTIKPNVKDETTSEKLKAIKFQLMALNNLIHLWHDNSIQINKYWVNKNVIDMEPKERALNNFKIMYHNIWGIDDSLRQVEFTTINNLYQYLEVSSRLLTGSINSPDVSLVLLAQNLSNYKDSSLVVTFYQLVSGNRDKNWDQAFSSLKNGGIMIFIGFIAILVAIVLLAMVLLNAFSRIFSLALLFIVSPAVVVLSPLDDGARLKGWIRAVAAKMTSIIGIILILRLFGTLHNSFSNLLTNSNQFSGNTGYMMMLILLAGFAIGGLFAANKGAQIISSIIGTGYGIMEGLQASQTLGMMRGIARGTKTAMVGGVGGLVTVASLGTLNRNRQQALAKSGRQKLGSLFESARSSPSSQAKTSMLTSFAKAGSTRTSLSLANKKLGDARTKATKIITQNQREQDRFTKVPGGNLLGKFKAKRLTKIRNAQQNVSSALHKQKAAMKNYNKRKRGKN